MIKFALAASAAVVALATVYADDAFAGGRRYHSPFRAETGATEEVRYRFYGRAHSVQSNGLCKRDTGTPTGDLNFRNKCDVEEYWARVFENGRRR